MSFEAVPSQIPASEGAPSEAEFVANARALQDMVSDVTARYRGASGYGVGYVEDCGVESSTTHLRTPEGRRYDAYLNAYSETGRPHNATVWHDSLPTDERQGRTYYHFQEGERRHATGSPNEYLVTDDDGQTRLWTLERRFEPARSASPFDPWPEPEISGVTADQLAELRTELERPDMEAVKMRPPTLDEIMGGDRDL